MEVEGHVSQGPGMGRCVHTARTGNPVAAKCSTSLPGLSALETDLRRRGPVVNPALHGIGF